MGYLHGCADAYEYPVRIGQRDDISRSHGMRACGKRTFKNANVPVENVHFFDIYSCFPSAVQIACREIGIDYSDGYKLTVTGGLPFHGGPGNNYSLHGIVAMVEKLRMERGAF